MDSTLDGNDNSTSQHCSQETQDRPLYLLIFSGAIFHAHWSFFTPRLDSSNIRKGKRSQVEGNPHSGFHLELVRGCNLDVDAPSPVHIIEIGRLDGANVNDGPVTEEWTVDTQATDAFEDVCCAVEPPTPSLRENAQSTGDKRGQKPRRVEIRDCQWWATQVVRKLVNENRLLPPKGGNYEGQQPVSIMQKAPKNA